VNSLVEHFTQIYYVNARNINLCMSLSLSLSLTHTHIQDRDEVSMVMFLKQYILNKVRDTD
jgi:hypothetical protein